MVSVPRIGIALRGDQVVIAVHRRGGIELESAERPAEQAWSEFLTELIASQRIRTWRRIPVGVCVADARCRVVPLFGADAVAEAAQVAREFTAAPQAFTIPGPDGLVAGNVWSDESGWHGVVLARALQDALVAACRGAGVDLCAIAPSSDPAHDDLEQLARSACALGSDDRVIVDPERPAREARLRRMRRGTLGAVAFVAASWALVAPVAIQARATWALERQAAPAERFLAGATRSDSAREEALALQSALAVIDRGRGDVSTLLDLLGTALEDSSAITALRLDPRSGAITIVAPHASDALARLVMVPTLRRARISGPIEREEADGLTLERTTLTWDSRDRR